MDLEVDPYMRPRERRDPPGLSGDLLERVRLLQRGTLLMARRELGEGIAAQLHHVPLEGPAGSSATAGPKFQVQSTKKRRWRRRPRYRW